MTKGELTKLLEELDDDDEIYVAIPTHNYWRHVKVVPLQRINFEDCSYSSYNESYIISEDGTEKLVVIS